MLIFDRIHDAIHLNKDVQDLWQKKTSHNIKDPAVHLTVDMGYFLSLFVLNSSGGFAAKKLFFFFFSSGQRSQCYLKFQSCLTTEYAEDCFWMSEDNFS